MRAAALSPLAISMGEPAGIGPDLILQLFADRVAHDLPPFIVYGDAAFLRNRATRLGLAMDVATTTPKAALGVFATALPVADIGGATVDEPGITNPLAATLVIEAISRAVADTLGGICRGLVTAPIHKATLYGAGFSFPGHTEFLASLCAQDGKVPMPVMMLAHDDLRVVPATVHVPLSQVPSLLTTDLLVAAARIVANDLRARFGIAAPRLAMTGLNPHAGEGGTMGREEIEVIAPAVARLNAEGIAIDGPIPADTLFHLPHWRRYDAVIAMYHDQALIPIKTVAFDAAVNITLGLPILRTSPDHGTAFDLAGSGKASSASFLAAIRLADKLTGGSA